MASLIINENILKEPKVVEEALKEILTIHLKQGKIKKYTISKTVKAYSFQLTEIYNYRNVCNTNVIITISAMSKTNNTTINILMNYDLNSGIRTYVSHKVIGKITMHQSLKNLILDFKKRVEKWM